MFHTKLSDISFPIYRLPDEPIVEEGVLFYYSEKEYADGSIKETISIVDDRNIPGDTLAARRLKLLAEGVTLYKLSTAIFFIADLIKISSGRTIFLDSNGKLFKYKKETFYRLNYYYIDKVIPTQGGGAVICIRGLPQRFRLLHMPDPSKKYAAILHTGMELILYGVYDTEPEKSSRKMM